MKCGKAFILGMGDSDGDGMEWNLYGLTDGG